MDVGERRTLAASVGWMFQGERARRDLSQARVAERLGVTQQWVSKVERGSLALTTEVIDKLFAVFDLQVRLDLEPAGSDLDSEIDVWGSFDDDDRIELVRGFWRPLDQLRSVPLVLSGRLGAFVQGAPLRVRRLDLVIAEGDLDALGRIFERETCDRWNERLQDFYGAPVHPLKPGAMRWLLGQHELWIEVADRLPPAITVVVAGRPIRVRPLADIEATWPDIARLMRRARCKAIHREQ